ncbi:hypothetical protein ACFE04_000205 [Oxalis oulophora]
MGGLKFLCVMTDSFLKERVLKIPEVFPKSIADKMKDYVSIKTPSGLSWKVGVGKKAGGTVFLHDLGSSDFSEHHGLELGSVLIFECQRATKLINVTIFDETDLEISYPSSIAKGRKEIGRQVKGFCIVNICM